MFTSARLFQYLILIIVIYSPPVFADLTWVGCGITKKAFMSELTKAFEQDTGLKIDIQGGGATKGIRDVATLQSDLGGSCRHTLFTEAENDVVLMPIAWDALVVVVKKDNPLDNISLEDLRGVYSGKINHWSELGLTHDRYNGINLHIREGKISGVGLMSRLLIFHDEDMEFAGSYTHPSSGPLEEALEQDDNGIAITGISSAIRRGGLKILKLDGVEANFDTITNGEYPLIRPLYLTIHRSRLAYGDAFTFVTFALSPKGQEIIKQSGAVPHVSIQEQMFSRFYKNIELAKEEIKRLEQDKRTMEVLFDLELEDLVEVDISQ